MINSIENEFTKENFLTGYYRCSEYAGELVLSKSFHKKLLKLQKQHAEIEVEGRYLTPAALLLGCDSRGVVTDCAYLNKCKLVNMGFECDYQSQLKVENLSRATNELIKKGLTPCGILKVFPGSNSMPTFSGSGGSFARWTLSSKFKIWALGRRGMSVVQISKIERNNILYKEFGWKFVD